MEKPENSYILNYDTKEVILTWRGEKFVFNLNDGDIGDYWNSLTHSSGLQKDVNFHQEEGEEPNFEIWNLIEDEDGQLIIDTDEEYVECEYTEGFQGNYFNPPDKWGEIDGVECEDCGDKFLKEELIPWRYEPEVKLCANCTENRDNEEEEDDY